MPRTRQLATTTIICMLGAMAAAGTGARAHVHALHAEPFRCSPGQPPCWLNRSLGRRDIQGRGVIFYLLPLPDFFFFFFFYWGGGGGGGGQERSEGRGGGGGSKGQ